ncbi:hypothetical protein INF35_10640 [Subdoligranulum sp. DSM 109015]|uniref:Foldase protein PrsA n=1 Tax=Gemmiger gallinarum TaxID=2779354 RepID=A0ABR9R509_9FIRM|nr:hypothetical protein [Gemmiger gallinarum]MBE5038243.1 hypothetical protein [Gemmiger gallinarum]
MKKKFISLGLALAMLLGVAGCNITTPATVGSIGGVEIPAGIYLLAQYNAYSTAASNADLATGETANDVSAVLKASVTGTIGDEEVTTDGADYISRLTQRAIEYYAAVETMFDELGATLEDAATSEAAENADSMWESNGDVYEANGISKDTLEAYLLNGQKAQACLEYMYGENGQQPVTEAEYEEFLKNDCRYIDSVYLPLMDTSTYTFASSEQAAAIDTLADDCLAYLKTNAPASMDSTSAYMIMYQAALEYVPQAMEILGSTDFDKSQSVYYCGSQLYTPSSLSSYDDGNGGNMLTDAVDAAGYGGWVKVNLGTAIVLVRKVNPLEQGTVSNFQTQYDLLSELKGEDFTNELYAEGAAMEHNLNESAMNTYKASNIKRSV